MDLLTSLREEETVSPTAEDHKEVRRRMALIRDDGVRQEVPLTSKAENGVDIRRLKPIEERRPYFLNGCNKLVECHSTHADSNALILC